MISTETEIPAFLHLDPAKAETDKNSLKTEEEHYYCQRGMHIEVILRNICEPKDLMRECNIHETLMINLVLSDEFIARQLMMDRVELNG